MKLIVFSIFLFLGTFSYAQSMDKALTFIEEGEILNAKNELIELTGKDAKNLEAKFWLGVALSMEYLDPQLNPEKNIKKLIDAGISFEKALYLNHEQIEPQKQKHIKVFQNLAYNAGISNYQESDLDIAFTLFKMSAQSTAWLQEEDEQSSYFAGSSANAIGEFQSALKYLEPIAKENPSNEKYSKELLMTYTNLKMYDKASSLISQALVYNQSSKYFWYENMTLNMKMDKPKEALKSAKQLAQLDASNSKNLALLASMYDQSGEEELAIETYKKVVEMNPNNVQATFNLGVMLYNKALTINKTALSKDELAEVEELLHEAETYLLVAQQLDSSNMDVPVILGNIKSMK